MILFFIAIPIFVFFLVYCSHLWCVNSRVSVVLLCTNKTRGVVCFGFWFALLGYLEFNFTFIKTKLISRSLKWFLIKVFRINTNQDRILSVFAIFCVFSFTSVFPVYSGIYILTWKGMVILHLVKPCLVKAWWINGKRDMIFFVTDFLYKLHSIYFFGYIWYTYKDGSF